MSMLVVGSVAFDNVETMYGKADNVLGGAALYFANAASFFDPVNLVGVVGADFNLDDIAYLKDRNVSLDGVMVRDGKTFRWGGRYHQDMNHRDTLFTELNVFGDFHPDIPEAYRESEIVFLANIHPDLQMEVLHQVEQPKQIIMDTMNFWIAGERPALMKLLKQVDILIINDEEARELAEETHLVKAVSNIHRMGPETVIVKKGEHGAILYRMGDIFAVPAYPLETVYDPTGAGDTFAGGFVGHLSRSAEMDTQTLREAMVYGSVMASFVCEDFSFDRLKSLSADEVEDRFREFRRMTAF